MSDKEITFVAMMFEQFRENEFVTTAGMVKISGLPISTVRRYMTKFCEKGIIYSVGKNKGTKYYPGEGTQ